MHCDVQLVSVWGGATSSTGNTYIGYSRGLSLYVSATTTYSSGSTFYLCRAGFDTTQGVEMLVWCDGYSGFSAQYVSVGAEPCVLVDC